MGLRQFYVLLFFVTLGAMMVTGSPVIIATWLLMWWLVFRVDAETPGMEVLLFWIAASFLYPQLSTAYRAFHESEIVMTTILVLFVIVFFPRFLWGLSRERLVAFVVVAWLGWATLAYAPVFLAWLSRTVLHLPLPGFLHEVNYYGSTALKVAVPVVGAVLAASVPVASVVRRRDVDAVISVVLLASGVMIFLSFAQWLAGFDFVPVEYGLHAGRMHGFSNPHPNGLGRQLLFPVLLACSAAIVGYGRRRVWPWMLCTAGVVSIVLTQSRTTYASCLAGLLVLMLLNLRRARYYAVMTALVSLILLAVLTTGVAERFAVGGERATLDNLVGRQALYEKIFVVIRANPWFGARPGGYEAGILEAGYEGQFGSAHNMLLAVAAEWGIPMAALLLFALVWAAFVAVGGVRAAQRMGGERGPPPTLVVAQSCAACAVAFLVHGFTEIVPPWQVFFVFGLAVAGRNAIRVEQAASPVTDSRCLRIDEGRPTQHMHRAH